MSSQALTGDPIQIMVMLKIIIYTVKQCSRFDKFSSKTGPVQYQPKPDATEEH